MGQRTADEPERSGLDTLEQSMSVGYGATAAILLFSVGGYALDRWLGTAPWLFIVGVIAGLSITFFGFGGLIQSRISRR
jgi:F0F1-type ATP synthase assembly protein I